MPGSDPVSTWQGLNTIMGPNFPDVQCSQYVVPNKVIASVDWTIPFTHKGLTRDTKISLFYSGYSFSGYSYCYSNDMNGDNISNDLMYIPRDNSEINFKSEADRDAFWAFVEQDSYLKNHKGQYAEAYSTRAPWTHRFDLRIAEDFQFRVGSAKHTIQLSFDIMNIGNLFNPAGACRRPTGATTTAVSSSMRASTTSASPSSRWSRSTANIPPRALTSTRPTLRPGSSRWA